MLNLIGQFDRSGVAQVTFGGSRGFSRRVAIMMPMPRSAATPTPTHTAGAFSRIAAIASAMMRMMKPMRYVAKDDIPALTANPALRFG